MAHAAETLERLGVAFEVKVVSAHRTPDLLFEYASTAEQRGLHVIIAGAGGAAHLPGMAAAKTLLPVLGVPVESKVLRGVDSLLSIVQMPAGIPSRRSRSVAPARSTRRSPQRRSSRVTTGGACGAAASSRRADREGARASPIRACRPIPRSRRPARSRTPRRAVAARSEKA